MTTVDVLLTIEETAERLRTSERFVRRLIEERRITYVKLGTHVRIEESALLAFIAASRVRPAPHFVAMRRAA